jgi:hypothetical protein
MTIVELAVIFFAGIATGILGALLGLGGGVFLIPFLVLAFGIPMHVAIATSLVAIIATSSAGAIVNLGRHTVNIRLGMLLETLTVFGAICGGITAGYLRGSTLTLIFGVVLLIVSVILFFKRNNSDQLHLKDEERGELGGILIDPTTQQEHPYAVHRVPWTMLVSLVAGNVSGLLGVGGGIFKVPAMYLISGIPIKAATATSNFMIGVTAAASAFIYFSNGYIDPVLASVAAMGVLPGSLLGTSISHRIKSKTIILILNALIIVIATQMIWKSLR